MAVVLIVSSLPDVGIGATFASTRISFRPASPYTHLRYVADPVSGLYVTCSIPLGVAPNQVTIHFVQSPNTWTEPKIEVDFDGTAAGGAYTSAVFSDAMMTVPRDKSDLSVPDVVQHVNSFGAINTTTNQLFSYIPSASSTAVATYTLWFQGSIFDGSNYNSISAITPITITQNITRSASYQGYSTLNLKTYS